MPTRLLLAALVLSAAAFSQKVVPPGFAAVEGNSLGTYPFGRDVAGLQVIVDPEWASSVSGAVTSVAFRPNVDFRTSQPGYTKGYRLEMAATHVPAASMTTDPVLNLGGATPTVVFDGLLNVPNSAFAAAPEPFSIAMPLATPWIYDRRVGGLLMTLGTTDGNPTPGRYRIDAVTIRTDRMGGIASNLSTGCSNGLGQTLDLDFDLTTLHVGGSLDVTPDASTAGAFPTAALLIGLTRTAIDLTPVQMPGCLLEVQDSIALIVQDPGQGFPQISTAIPAAPALEGGNLFVQGLGWAQPPNSLQNSVTSPVFGVRIGAPALPIVRAQSIFSLDQVTWSIASGSIYVPVVELGGTLQ